MASLALGVAGAAIGSFFGPLGTSVGWALGSAIGGRLGAKGQEGPRLTDLRAQTSAYGMPIPIGYGTIRIAGNVIWAADIVEHKKKSGGKGGPKTTTYSYTQSFAVALLETSFLQDGALVNNPMVGILRVWADSRLIYGEGSDGTTLPMTIYYGTEDQLPDPTIEADKGAGNVPAHRGMAYVVFTDLELASFGNRIPNLTFEVIASGAIAMSYYATWAVDYDYPVNGSAYSTPYILNGVENTADGLILHRYRAGSDYGVEMGTADDAIIYYDRSLYDLKGVQISTDARVSSAMTGAVQDLYGSLNSDIAYAKWQVVLDCGAGNVTFNTFAWLKAGVVTYSPPDLCAVGSTSRQLPINAAPVYWNGYVYASGSTLYGVNDLYLRRWSAPDGSVYVEDPDAGIAFNADAVRTGYPSALGYYADAGDIIIADGYLYWLVGYYAGGGDGTRLFKFDSDLNLLQTWWTGSGADLPTAGYGSTAIYRGHIIGYFSAGVVLIGVACYVMNRLEANGTTTFVTELQMDGTAIGGAAVSPVHYIGNGLAAVRDGIIRLGSEGVLLSEIVGNVSQHVGYADTQYDVTQLTDIVRGYQIGQRMSARAAIEALQPAYQFGAVESNLTAKFVKWGGQVVATVTADDLGARDDSSDPVDPIRITHLDDKQLPQRIEAVFLNLEMDYQEGMQYAQRTASASDVAAAVTLPIVLVDAEAKAIADALLYNAWIERDRYSPFSLPRKWAHLEPTDVINVDGHAVRITNKDEQGYTHIGFEGLATRVGVFINGPVAVVPIGFVPQVPPSLNRTDLILLDLPLITDTDFEAGFYAAIAGRMEGAWPGAAVFKSIDGGVNYDSVYSTVENDTFGVATTALGSFAGGNIFDETNTVTVRLTPGSDELASSNELGVLNGANRAMLGDEMIQFKTATLTAARTYTLSGLRRYLRGTDRGAATPTHSIGEDFALLPIHNIEGSGLELGQSRKYKGVTSGGLLASATAQDFTNNGIALKPYAPVSLGGGRNGAGDINLTWVRRTRIGGAWTDNVDVPLSEQSEYYRIRIFSNSSYSTVLATDFASVAAYDYLAADQTTDFGSPQATLYFGIAQSGSYGYGYEARGVA